MVEGKLRKTFWYPDFDHIVEFDGLDVDGDMNNPRIIKQPRTNPKTLKELLTINLNDPTRDTNARPSTALKNRILGKV